MSEARYVPSDKDPTLKSGWGRCHCRISIISGTRHGENIIMHSADALQHAVKMFDASFSWSHSCALHETHLQRSWPLVTSPPSPGNNGGVFTEFKLQHWQIRDGGRLMDAASQSSRDLKRAHPERCSVVRINESLPPRGANGRRGLFSFRGALCTFSVCWSPFLSSIFSVLVHSFTFV